MVHAVVDAADRDAWLVRVAGIKRWSRAGERAPHKPLLLLYALGRLQRLGTSSVSYADAEPELQALLDEFGPSGRKTTPAYPFHFLQSDGLWVVESPEGRDPGTSVTRLRAGAVGRLSPDLESALLADPGLAALAGRALLDECFPESLHADICALAGLSLENLEVEAARARVSRLERRRRDPAFRSTVLTAYEHRCAMCGYDGRLGATTVALDAAHIRWHAYEGPDEVDNALCLCTLHHKLLDLGAVGITDDRTVAVSAQFIGRSDTAARLVIDLVGRALLEPQPGFPAPVDDHVSWHHREVFRPPARAAG